MSRISTFQSTSLSVVILLLMVLRGPVLECQGREPQIKALVPGLQVQRIPVQLTNINSLEYGPDGRLYAAGYDGRVHVLTDTDGDGVEDQADLFWSKAGDLLTPVGILPTKEGVYLAVRGKIALLKDTDGDGAADVSETVVSGWKREKINSDTRNDAAGIALDRQGNLYFSLGCMSYNNAWQLDSKGKSHYDIHSERGTILKVSPDRKTRQVLVTGTRFIIGLDINQHGDLFATDQEGDTWFPGGNPRDELLHVIPGRHYGFPFRHPKYLPDVVDEPAVVGFSPQHQSTCGFRFNEQRDHRAPFGPDHWEGNALVTGFSRGKLWRVPLVKTRAGYVGKQIQFLSIEGLPTDLTVSPRGDLVVTCHSGRPDWGAGPAASGRLYKIHYDRNIPQPVCCWPSSPFELSVAFDAPIDPQKLGPPRIEVGAFVREGDQHEWIWPGYEVVKAEKKAFRQKQKVFSRRISSDRRTVTYSTTPLPWRARYGITLPGVAASDSDAKSKGETVELSCDMSGVSANWIREGEEQPAWSGWLPHLDSQVAFSLTQGSSEHARLQKLVNERGRLSLRAQLILPGQKVRLRFTGASPFVVRCGSDEKKSQVEGTRQIVEMNMTGKKAPMQDQPRGGREQVLPTERVQLEIEIFTNNQTGAPLLDASYQADYDPHERPLRLEHLSVPWAPRQSTPPGKANEISSVKELDGDPERGRAIFFGKKANCAACHRFGGQGGTVAADLTVSVHRDPDAVLRDIIEPGAAINPEYVSYVVVTESGRSLTGLFRSADDNSVTLIDAQTKIHRIPRDEIEAIRASNVSLMPTGFARLGKQQLEDLVAFLCSEDPVAKRQGLPTGVISREYWLNLSRVSIQGLTSLPDFPDHPDGLQLLTRFEGPRNWKEHYGARIYGFIHPPQTGDYVFWLAADDHAEIWLSEDQKPSREKRIVKLDRWTRADDWNTYPEQKSKPIHLEAGKRYFIEAIQVEATVDDCLSVGWRLPDGTLERPIPGKRLSSGR
ncbi:DUF7133 domain-containing protein [Gimesia panareensis]|nr:PA14 domain protein [Gimesia panareensis]